jgi:PAS domain S-box-containing protein
MNAYASKKQVEPHPKLRREDSQPGIEQTQAEEALLDSEQRFQAVWEAASDAMALSTADGIVHTANPAYYRLYGFQPEEVIGKTFSVIFPEEQRAWAEKLYEYFFSSPTISPSFEATIIRADGTERIVESSYSFLIQDGKRLAMLSTIRDITERKKAEEGLRENELKLHLALKAAHMVTWDWDVVQNTLCWSSNLDATLSSTLQKLGATYEAFLELVHPEDRTLVNQKVQRALWEGADYKVKFRRVHPDGTVWWTLSHGQVLYDDAGKPISMIGISMNVSNRKRIESTD